MPAPRMKRCRNCAAPNPEERAACYACGRGLSADAEIIRPGAAAAAKERTYPCANCNSPIPFTAPACPQCGRVAPDAEAFQERDNAEAEPFPLPLGDSCHPKHPTPATPSPNTRRVVVLPPLGWDAEPLPDGTTILRRTAMARLDSDAAIPAMLLIGMFIACQIVAAVSRQAKPALSPEASRYMLYGMFGIVGLTALIALAWAIFGREEIRVGPGLLEVRRRLLGIEKSRRLPNSVFRLETRANYGDSRGRVTHRLFAENRSGRTTLEQQTRHRGPDGFSSEQELRSLGNYLSAKTGWPFTDPDALGYLR